MKHERLRTALIALALALSLCFGSMGCFLTGLRLTPPSPVRLAVLWIAAALVCVPVLSRRHGSEILLCLGALALGYLLREGRMVLGLKTLICTVADRFDDAYGWGTIRFPGYSSGNLFAPLGLWGCFLTAAVCRSVCRRRGAALPVAAAFALPGLCAMLPGANPAGWALFLLLGAGAILLLTAGVRQESSHQGNRLTAMAALPVAACLGLLFLLNPSDSYVNHAESLRESLSQAGVTLAEKWELKPLSVSLSLPGAVDLSALAGAEQPRVPVMTVTAEKTGPLYLRGRDYDRYTGGGWEASEDRREPLGGWGEAQRVTVSTFSLQESLYLPYYPPEEVVLEGGSTPNRERLLSYTAIAYSTGAAVPAQSLQVYLTLPEETALWASRLAPGGGSAAEKAAAIGAYVRQSARYDKKTGKMPPEASDFARWFLEQSDTGYCVHFATAATVLLRAAGVPARYVTGYRAEAAAGRAVTVTSEEAHAWAEYYDDALGCWRILEATPSAGEAAPPEEPAPADTALEPDSGGSGTAPSRGTLPILFRVLIFAAALAPVPVLRRHLLLWLRRRRKARADINRRALLWWQEAERLSGALGSPVPEALKALAEKARYSQHRLTPMDLIPLTDYCRQCRRALEQKGWLTRLVNRYVRVLY